MAHNTSAEKGNIFVLTEKGFNQTPDSVKHERKTGNPIKGYEYKVPTSWILKGYVEQMQEENYER